MEHNSTCKLPGQQVQLPEYQSDFWELYLELYQSECRQFGSGPDGCNYKRQPFDSCTKGPGIVTLANSAGNITINKDFIVRAILGFWTTNVA